ncbi:hypothetical protein [Treponema sp.]|uniref:hypothetical protein n=1 Tax=Treponema sp. TaxID=166 RepID=UPI00298E8E28|nr:hypothetical protein [Treponema sp.]
MISSQRLRMTIDITMTILSIILMGGNYLFPADLVHEILGVGLFILWGVWKYLILQQQFLFFDLERGYILFALDYISIIILFATISHLVTRRLKKNR